jgi:hypothetical protein
MVVCAMSIFWVSGVTAGATEGAHIEAGQKMNPSSIQNALLGAGFYHGRVDGINGPRTRKAITLFQETHHLEVDGICGSQTWAKLKLFLPDPAMEEASEIVSDIPIIDEMALERDLSSASAKKTEDLRKKLIA